jgi:hypothetical protein
MMQEGEANLPCLGALLFMGRAVFGVATQTQYNPFFRSASTQKSVLCIV